MGHPRDKAEIALLAAALGAVLGCALALSSAALAAQQAWALPVLLYAGAVSLFHFLEFYMTARVHDVGAHAFLLDHSRAYWAGILIPLAEHGLWALAGVRPSAGVRWSAFVFGACVACAGQALRSRAMHDAGASFTHLVAEERLSGHELVTRGVFSFVRHPAYCGFYAWVVGLQLVLWTPVSLAVLAAVMQRFFAQRIAHEEAHLVRFFGRAYLQYRRGRPSGVPFVS